MKTKSCIYSVLLAGMATASWSFAPVLHAQTTTADTTQSSKADDSTAEKHNAATGTANTATSSDQPGTLDRTSSKDTDNPLDKNPSTTSTDSADKAATKDPNSSQPEKQHAMGAVHRTSDREFLVKAAQGGMTEVELGKLAQEKGSSAEVKQFGSHMVMDHSKADADLKAVAAKTGVTVPTTLDARHQATVDHFRTLSGPAFDKAYVHAMVKDHEKDAAEFRAESTEGQNPDVKNFAGSTLKVIETHLSDIKSLENKVQ